MNEKQKKLMQEMTDADKKNVSALVEISLKSVCANTAKDAAEKIMQFTKKDPEGFLRAMSFMERIRDAGGVKNEQLQEQLQSNAVTPNEARKMQGRKQEPTYTDYVRFEGLFHGGRHFRYVSNKNKGTVNYTTGGNYYLESSGVFIRADVGSLEINTAYGAPLLQIAEDSHLTVGDLKGEYVEKLHYDEKGSISLSLAIAYLVYCVNYHYWTEGIGVDQLLIDIKDHDPLKIPLLSDETFERANFSWEGRYHAIVSYYSDDKRITEINVCETVAGLTASFTLKPAVLFPGRVYLVDENEVMPYFSCKSSAKFDVLCEGEVIFTDEVKPQMGDKFAAGYLYDWCKEKLQKKAEVNRQMSDGWMSRDDLVYREPTCEKEGTRTICKWNDHLGENECQIVFYSDGSIYKIEHFVTKKGDYSEYGYAFPKGKVYFARAVRGSGVYLTFKDGFSANLYISNRYVGDVLIDHEPKGLYVCRLKEEADKALKNSSLEQRINKVMQEGSEIINNLKKQYGKEEETNLSEEEVVDCDLNNEDEQEDTAVEKAEALMDGFSMEAKYTKCLPDCLREIPIGHYLRYDEDGVQLHIYLSHDNSVMYFGTGNIVLIPNVEGVNLTDKDGEEGVHIDCGTDFHLDLYQDGNKVGCYGYAKDNKYRVKTLVETSQFVASRKTTINGVVAASPMTKPETVAVKK